MRYEAVRLLYNIISIYISIEAAVGNLVKRKIFLKLLVNIRFFLSLTLASCVCVRNKIDI